MQLSRIAAALALALLLALRLWNPAFLEELQLLGFDLYQQLHPRAVPSAADQPAVIVDIDEASLAAYGQWPWPRNLLAEMVRRLHAMGARVIGFDIAFAEPDRLSPARLAATVPEALRPALAVLPDNDALFAAAIAQAPVVLGEAVAGGARTGGLGWTKASLIFRGEDPRPFIPAVAGAGFARNLPVLEEAAAGLGLLSIGMEKDSIVRRAPVLTRLARDVYPDLDLEMLRMALSPHDPLILETGPGGLSGISVGDHAFLPTDEEGRIWIHFSPHAAGRFISAREVLAGTADPAKVKDKLVLVGTSFAGLNDLWPTPLAATMPGVEVRAQLLENILGGGALRRADAALVVEIAVALAVGLGLIILLPKVGARLSLLVVLLGVGGQVGWSWYAFTRDRLLYDVTFPLLTTAALFLILAFAGYAREEAGRRFVRGAMSRYLSPALVERLADNPAHLRLGGEIRDMTLLFCDIRDFTALSEKLDAQSLTRLINGFLTPMTEVILAQRGTIDKYMGDCIMAFWNAPLDDPDHARNACRAALMMRRRLSGLGLGLSCGISLNSGPCCVGNMGSDQRFDYSALGDTVNLAARLEGQSKTYGADIIVGEETRLRARDFAFLELDLLRVKGKSAPIRVFALLGDEAMAKDPRFHALGRTHAALLAAYRRQDWAAAREALADCRTADFSLSGLYDVFTARIAAFEAHPPGPEWDGVFSALAK